MNFEKPNFSTTQNAQSQEDLSARRKQRIEYGCIWERTSKANMKYFTIKLKMTKTELQTLINSPEVDGAVNVNLVAFPNKTYEENSNRPIFRIYKELK